MYEKICKPCKPIYLKKKKRQRGASTGGKMWYRIPKIQTSEPQKGKGLRHVLKGDSKGAIFIYFAYHNFARATNVLYIMILSYTMLFYIYNEQ